MLAPGLVAMAGRLPQELVVASAKQCLPNLRRMNADSIGRWAQTLSAQVADSIAPGGRWMLHVFANYRPETSKPVGARAQHSTRLGFRPGRCGEDADSSLEENAGGGVRRCELIRGALLEILRKRQRTWLRGLDSDGALQPDTSLIQLSLTAPDAGWLSVSNSPQPHQLRRLIVPFPNGQIPVAVDKAAPSRAFAKLVEAELRFGRRIASGETCVDLGASPGGWTWVARQRGARVIAVDRSPLREDLMADPAVTFFRGDAFSYQPDRPVDWLVCDVIAAPERSIELVLEWARRRWARHFVVTIKLREGDHPKLDRLKQEMPAFSDDWYLTHLCANKHEACVFGSVRPEGNVIAVAGSATA